LNYYVEQDDTKVVREWFKENRISRKEEAERLKEQLEDVEEVLDRFLPGLEKHLEYQSRNSHNRYSDIVPNLKEREIERYHQSLWDRRRDILRQLRDLVRWERDDLEWMERLERKEREASRHYSSETKQQERAANWKQERENRTANQGPAKRQNEGRQQ